MRRVADQLGAGVASLYWHVGNKEELLQFVFDRIISEIDLPPPDPSRWQEQIKEMGRSWRRVLRRHRDAARISLGRIPLGERGLETIEWAAAVLRGAGLPDRVIAYAGDLFALYVDAYTYEESLGFRSPTGEDVSPEQMGAMMQRYFESLPAGRFPNVVALAAINAEIDPEARFEFGLDLLVRGLAAWGTGSEGRGKREEGRGKRGTGTAPSPGPSPIA
jgi:AcrR family transcriptional regulator